jgi:hypothetical protein
MTESWTGNPPPLLEKVVVSPPDSATATVKEETEDTDGMLALNE